MSVKNPVAALKIADINAMNASQMVESEIVEKKFIKLYNQIHGSELGEAFYYKEKFNFLKLVNETPALKECTTLSLYGSFLDIAVNGLSLDNTGGRAQCYLLSRNAKVKTPEGKDAYEKRANIMVSGYGELVMRQRAGQVRYVDNPVIIYEKDHFQPELISGKKTVSYKGEFPRTSNKIVGAFIRIVRVDGSEDYQWLLESDITRLSGYSKKANRGEANALYTSFNGCIDPGFLESKMIKHAFDAYPKVRTGEFTSLETNEEPKAIDYGIEDAQELIQASSSEDNFDEYEVNTEAPQNEEQQNSNDNTY